MTIEINTDYLLKQKLTPNQFTVLQLVVEGDYKALEELKGVYLEFTLDIEALKQRGLLLFEDGVYKVSTQYLRTLKGKGYFEEFYALYPTSVIRSDGMRDSLRTAKKQCERKYKRLVKRQDQHEHIINCLKYELKERRGNDNMKYMKRMPNWLNEEVWKEYEEKMKIDSLFHLDEEDDEPYGTTVI